MLRERNGRDVRFRPPLFDNTSDPEPADVVVVTVKAHATRHVAPALGTLLQHDGLAVTLQNGLGNAEIMARNLRDHRVVLGPCTYGAFLDEQGRVRLGGEGQLVLGAFSGSGNLEWLAELFRCAGFSVVSDKDPLTALWEKLVVNAGINPLTALARCTNGVLLEADGLRRLMYALISETVAVARSEGILIDEKSALDRCLTVCEKTSQNRSSMLQDVAAGRRTENESISGEILRRGEACGIPVPVTRTICRLLRGVDHVMGG